MLACSHSNCLSAGLRSAGQKTTLTPFCWEMGLQLLQLLDSHPAPSSGELSRNMASMGGIYVHAHQQHR